MRSSVKFDTKTDSIIWELDPENVNESIAGGWSVSLNVKDVTFLSFELYIVPGCKPPNEA